MAKKVKQFKPKLIQLILTLVLLPLMLFTVMLLVLKDVSLQAAEALIIEDKRCASVRNLCLRYSSWSNLGDEMLSLAPSPSIPPDEYIQSGNWLNQNGLSKDNKWTSDKIGGNQLTTDIVTVDRLLSIKAVAISLRDRILSEWQDELNLRESGDKKVRLQKSLAFIFAGTDAIVAILAVWLAFRALVSRLHIMMRNAGAIGVTNVAMERVGGDDEITFLNEVVRSVHQDLLESTDLYEMTVSMVAHDVRSPLQSSLVNVRLMESVLSEHNEEARASLAKFANCLENELSSVSELLERQKEKQNASFTGTGQSEIDSVHQRKRWTQFTLLPKGLLLLLIPLCVQIAFFGIVNADINKKLQVVSHARHLSELMTGLQLAKLDYIAAGASYVSFILTGNDDLKVEFEIGLLSTRARLKSLAQMSKFNRAWLDLVNESEMILESQLNQIKQLCLKSSSEDISGTLAKVTELRESLPELRSIRKHGVALSQRETRQLEHQESESLSESNEVSTLFGWGLVGNILVVFGLLHWFKSDVQKRFAIIKMNASNLARQDIQLVSLKGADELTSLNDILGETKEQLDHSFIRRRELTQDLVSSS